ncbi:TPA: pentapeptide repeat-containing protein [Escherichia coli]|nr:pentapeptide repeat-containing protein [Escherichia coli]
MNAKEKWFNENYIEGISECIKKISLGKPIIECADLSGIIIGPSAVVDCLRKTNLSESEIYNSNLSYSSISANISSCNIRDVNFEYSFFDGVMLFKAKISNCNFYKSKLTVNMDDAICENNNFKKAKFTGGSLGYEYGGRRVKFINCDFTGAVFNRVEFRASRFLNCIFVDTKFKKCDLRGARFENGVLPLKTQFENMDIPIQFMEQ